MDEIKVVIGTNARTGMKKVCYFKIAKSLDDLPKGYKELVNLVLPEQEDKASNNYNYYSYLQRNLKFSAEYNHPSEEFILSFVCIPKEAR
ncbi:MAG: hypothetical protein ACRCZB_05000 [Bacteroidales bacterium]